MSRTYSQYSYFQTIIISPSIPEGLRVDQIGNSVRLSWLDKSNYEDGFVIERKEYGGSWRRVYFTDEQKDFFVDYGPFENNQTYYYRVSSYIILPNQSYLISDPGNEVNITVLISSSSVEDENIVEVEFGSDSSVSLDLNEKIRIYIKDPSEDVDYLWFFNSDVISVSGHRDFADVFSVKSGMASISVKKRDSSGESNISVTVSNNNIELNPTVVQNIRGRALNNSSIEILWNYSNLANVDISHFEIYRIERTGSSSKNNLINFSDLVENKIGIVPFDELESIYNFRDYGLSSGKYYIYTIVSVSKYNRNSLYVQDEQYDYVGNKNYIVISTEDSDIEIDPPLSFVRVGQSLYLGIMNSSNKTFSEIDWTIEENNSGSSLVSDLDVAYFEASDKSISEDSIKVIADSDEATARIIVTEII